MALSAGAVVAQFTAETGGFQKEVQKAENSVNTFAKNIEKKLKGVGASFQSIGDNLTKTGANLSLKVTTPLAALGGVALKTSMSFDDAMRKVQATSGATQEDFNALRNSALKFGSTTAHSASQVANAFNFLALAGWNAQQSQKAMPGLLSLSSAAGLDLAITADILTDTMSAFRMEASQANEVADDFAKIQSITNTNVAQLGEAMKYAAPAAAGFGKDLKETAGFLGILADNGIKGSMAGTTFTAVMRDLTKVNAKGKLAMDALGVSVFDKTGKMRPLVDIIVDLQKKTKNMTTEQRNLALSNIFGEQSLKGMNIALGTSEARLREVTKTMSNTTGTAENMAETMEGGLGGSFRALMSAIEGAQIKLGDALEPTIKNKVIPTIERLVGFLVNLINRFQNLSPQVQNFILIVLGIVMALGPVLVILGTFIGVIGKAIAILGTLSLVVGKIISIFTFLAGIFKVVGAAILFFTTPVGLIIAIGGVLIGIGIAIARNWDKVAGIFRGAGQAAQLLWRALSVIKMPPSLQKVIDGFKSLGNIPGIGGILKRIPGFADGVRNFGGGLAIVGERGPELVNLPKGADVFTNEESRRMTAGGGGITIETMNIKSGVDWELGASYMAQKLRLS